MANGYFEQKSAKFGLFILKTNNAENINRLESAECTLDLWSGFKLKKNSIILLNQINSKLNYSLFEDDKAE